MNNVMSVHLKDYIVENYDSVKSDFFIIYSKKL